MGIGDKPSGRLRRAGIRHNEVEHESLGSGNGEAATLAAPVSSFAPGGGGRAARRPLLERVSWTDALAASSALILALGFIHPAAYSAPTLRAATETIMTLFAVAAAALMCEQVRHTQRLRELLLLAAVLTLALSEFLANALPAALHLAPGGALGSVFPLAQLAIAGLLVLAARMPSDRLVLRWRRPVLAAFGLSVAICAVAGIGGWLLRGQLIPNPSSQSGLTHALQQPLGLVVLLCTGGLFTWAGAELAHRGRLENDRVFALLGGAAILLGAARLYFLALPWVSPDSMSLRECLRLAACGLIFCAAIRTDLDFRARTARAGAVAERRRVAQDLHDGLAQDLAFIAAHGPKIAEQLGDQHPVMQAARHALEVSRETISELSDVSSTSIREALEAIAHELGDRFGIQVVIEAASAPAIGGDTRNQLARITREAIANAARHGGAKRVLVMLKRTGSGYLLRVVDDGCGIPKYFAASDEGFGMRSIRERVAVVGGTLMVRPAPGKGTLLEVAVP